MNCTVVEKTNRTVAILWSKMAVTEGKSAATPMNSLNSNKAQLDLKMRYIMSLNSHWFKNGQPSKLKVCKRNPS